MTENMYVPFSISEEIPIDITEVTEAYQAAVTKAFEAIPKPDQELINRTINSHVERVASDTIKQIIEERFRAYLGRTNSIEYVVSEAIGDLIDEHRPEIEVRVQAYIDEKDQAVFDGRVHRILYDKVARLSQKYNVKQMLREAVDKIAKEGEK